jgi:hypothetical protein
LVGEIDTIAEIHAIAGYRWKKLIGEAYTSLDDFWNQIYGFYEELGLRGFHLDRDTN